MKIALARLFHGKAHLVSGPLRRVDSTNSLNLPFHRYGLEYGAVAVVVMEARGNEDYTSKYGNVIQRWS